MAVDAVAVQVLADLHRGRRADARASAVAGSLAVVRESRRAEGHHQEEGNYRAEFRRVLRLDASPAAGDRIG